MQTFAIGDIHGCDRTLAALLERMGYAKGDRLILLGDYVDKGPRSKQVLDMILEMRNEGHSIVTIRGNHEQMMLEAITEPGRERFWTFNGGLQTLESFALDSPEQIPFRYVEFIRRMPTIHEEAGCIFVHAGIDFKGLFPEKSRDKHLWIRKWEAHWDAEWLNGRKVIYGHTPTALKEIRARHAKLEEVPLLNLDNGCCYRYEDMGNLCGYCVETNELFVQPNVEG